MRALLLGLTLFSAVTLVSAAKANCPSGEFCAWTDANFGGQRFNWRGDDAEWEGFIPDNDSSWANHGISGPGIKDHVAVYSQPNFEGDVTICLGPGEEVSSNAVANDGGASHKWVMEC
ncbi:hypothetical protein GQ42DRAFT_160220 [Ramicandelaber brevisporus]|nr:hypothetical protein GQ42DRAFT_160220 [Ramicandelaber brevisporus]